MDMTYVSGRSFASVTSGTKDEDGDWIVNIVMSETINYPNGLVRQEEVSGFKKDKDFDLAHKTAMQYVLQQLQDLVYSKGFDSLIEGRDYQRSLEAGNGSDIEADEASSS